MNWIFRKLSDIRQIGAVAAKLILLDKKIVALCITIPAALVTSLMALGGSSTAPNIPEMRLASEPLYANSTIEKPAIALALSVEYPTVGAQYTAAADSDSDNSYTNSTEYIGYYDAKSCYTYNKTPAESIPAGYTISDYKRFDRVGAATDAKCDDAFSGNFLNWASSSAIDMLRLALSGGDRYIDTENMTILQRAIIPNGNPVCMWNSTRFPAKQLTKNDGGTNAYWGAVPKSMRDTADGKSIWVANTLNRIYFRAGANSSGDCGNTSGYSLGGAAIQKGPQVTNSNVSLPADAIFLGGEGNTYTFDGIQEVWFGAGSRWTVLPASGGIDCYWQGGGGPYGGINDPYSGTSKKCYVRAYSGTWTPPGLNSDGFFYARVQVCASNSNNGLLDARDYNFCRQYPSGKFKPTGVIQKYSDQLRLAAFGYLMDPTASYNNGRYGGVLRAPMKFVGSKTYDEFGQDNTPSTGNTNAEWNANTGVFVSNPDGYASSNAALNFGVSGVINYLNKFGRTGPTPGLYKTYDPVGELHYEALRYLQGLQPSAAAIRNINTAMYDGYPVYTEWADPYGGGRRNSSNYACVKSNIVVIGDINTHDGNRLPTPDVANNILDIGYWRGIVQAFEKDQRTVSYLDGQNGKQVVANPNGANNSVPSNSTSSQIMGSAYWAHTHDIRGTDWTRSPEKQRPGLRVKTIVFDVNEYGRQNKSDTRRFANQFFMAAKYGGFEIAEDIDGSDPYNIKGNPFKDQNGKDDNNVWQKKTAPGEASAYYLQSSARDVLSAFDEIFSRASKSARSIGGGVSASSHISASSGSSYFSAKFDPSNWSGDVVAEPITIRSGVLSVEDASWSASERLLAMSSPATNRRIFVGRESGVANPKATDFAWASIDSTLQTQLNKESPTSAADNLGEDRLNFLRGDRTKESNPFRTRSALLGDIVNSNVVYSGAPGTAYTGTGYSLFRNKHLNRTKAVFAGANDGMLHAFNASTGDELFAYIPSWMGPKLSALTSTRYATNHQNYVDAPSVVAEAQVGANNAVASDWKTVLVSGTGGGGAGVFALDVSDPSSFTASNVMWEFTHSDDVDMGNVIGQPQILKLRTNATGKPVYRWFAAVASGVNNYVGTGGSASKYSSGNPSLFFLALDKAVGTSWAEGTNYYKVNLPFDSTLSTTLATGVANFSVVRGSADEVNKIYVGDLHGRVWKLNFSGVAAADWSMENLSAFKNGDGKPYPMFIAQSGDTKPVAQPITAAPAIFNGPIVGGLRTYYLMIGTGKFLETSDRISTATNSIYTLYDDGTDSATGGSSAINGRSRLKRGSVDTTEKTITVPSFIWGKATSDLDTANPRSGWYVDMPSSGERLVSEITGRGSLYATFNTIIPVAAESVGSCSNANGSSNSYVINVGTGASTYVTSAGLLGPGTYFVDDDGTKRTAFDSAGQAIRITRQISFSPGSSGIGSTGVVNISEVVGRLSWRQINNYQDLKNGTP